MEPIKSGRLAKKVKPSAYINPSDTSISVHFHPLFVSHSFDPFWVFELCTRCVLAPARSISTLFGVHSFS
ncbi:hypothetical protein K7X08_028781 [Anisodus acutangulus]|uniref:Uncharacterized protein n=1 Tax=Anisodus acutangulus TaxID=402998 RepID=A0A9Q1L320_9SOLA|nr:hypothetical protein K7X08_028781 [Anisodus acutangulus]